MIKKIIVSGKECKELLKTGVDKASNLIKVTLGPSGRNAIIGRAYQYGEVTNDGVTIAKEIYLDNEIEQLGAEKIKEIAIATDDKAGDGTTTATVLAQAILNVGWEKINIDNSLTGQKVDPILIRNEINEACDLICKELDQRAKQITTLEDTQKVAFVSVENKEIAGTIALMYHTIGKDGSITVEDGYDELESEVSEGFEIEVGLAYEQMANKDDKTFTLEKPVILVTNHNIEEANQISPITAQLFTEGVKNLVIVSDNFSKHILQYFVATKLTTGFNVIAIKAPYFNKKEKMEDVAIALGTKLQNREDSDKLIADFGTCKKIIVSKAKTVFIKPAGDVNPRLKELTDEFRKLKNKYDKEQIRKRIAKLSGGVGLIRVGGETPSEREYWKKKIEDAVNATKYALQEGVIKGGGCTLMDISVKMKPNILSEAIKSPYNQIQENCGGHLDISDDIIDPVKTTKTALKNACRVAGLILTTEVAIADKYEKPKDFKDED